MQRRGWGPSPKAGRYGITSAAAGIIVLITLIGAWIIDQRGASAADKKLAELAVAAKTDPADLVARAGRSNRIVFLSDMHTSTSTKQFAARVITRMAGTAGLDAVVLEVGADQQRYIDQYFDRPQEDASVLLSRAKTTGAAGPASRAFIDLYRTIWSLNQKLGADQRIRVIAADLPGWPPASAIAPSDAARQLAERERHLYETVSGFLTTSPGARVLVFVSGLHALKSGAVVVRTGGTAPVTVTPLAAQLASTEEVFVALVDAAAGISGRQVAPYTGTRVAGMLEEQGIRGPLAMQITEDFDHLRQPVLEKQTPGMEFEITPRDYTLRAVADAYINLGR